MIARERDRNHYPVFAEGLTYSECGEDVPARELTCMRLTYTWGAWLVLVKTPRYKDYNAIPAIVMCKFV